MEKFSIGGLALVILGLFLVGVYYVPVQAGVSDNVSGWAWSSNIGWVNFNNNDSGAGGPAGGLYGVNIDNLGNISGYAWAPNLGWFSFNATDVSGCPGTNGNLECAPKMNLVTGVISGWARACAGVVGGTCVGVSRSDGWDGWVSLRGASPNYGITASLVSPREWSGWAWGGEVLGWLSFQGAQYSVVGPASSPAFLSFIVSVSANPNPGVVNQPVNFSALVGGGVAPYTYSWSGTSGLSGATSSVSKTYASIGSKTASVTVVDSSVPQKSQTVSVNVLINASSSTIIEVIP